MRVKCDECGYDWDFRFRVVSWLLKRSYKVRCPNCGEPVFLRRKRDLKEPRIDFAKKQIAEGSF